MSDLISREDAIKAVTIAVLADKDEIEALKAIPSVQVNGDLISRADAIETVDRWKDYDGDICWREAIDKAKDILSALQSADAEPSLKAIKRQIDEHWYLDPPSDEAVQGEWRTDKPTENGEYMVTLDAWGHRYVDVMHYAKPQMPNKEVDGTCWYRDDDEWGDVVYDDSDILAWMPLPTPYKGGDDE